MLVLTNRTRSRQTWNLPLHAGSLGGERWGSYYSVPTTILHYYGGTFASFVTYDVISDVVGKKKRNGVYDTSNVDSTKISVHTKYVPSYSPHPLQSPPDSYVVDRLDVNVHPSTVTSLVPLVPDATWLDFAEEAFNDFATQIPEEISIANFGWELQEITSLIPRISRSLTKTIAGGYLNLEFGWRPFLGDLNTLYSLCSTVQAKINHLKSTFGKTTRLGTFKGNVFNPNLSSYTTTYDHINLVGEIQQRLTLDGYRADLRAGAYLYHELEDLSELSGYIRAMIVALGLTNPLKVIWNALPYSFVVDWFTGLSQRLAPLSVNPFKGTWIVSRRSTSMKLTASIRVESLNIVPGASWTAFTNGNIVYQRYQRISQLPVRASFLSGLTSPTPKQQTLLAALLLG